MSAADSDRIAFQTHGFSIVVCQHPTTNKLLAVNESRGRGWWLPAGHVDRGQTFKQAAVREALEEAGIQVTLAGILAVEHSIGPRSDEARMRVIFFARPTDPDAPVKSMPDAESDGAAWLTIEELEALARKRPPEGVRGRELLRWGTYLRDGGVPFPLDLLQVELDGPSQALSAAGRAIGHALRAGGSGEDS
jgi:phosphatase NudJ